MKSKKLLISLFSDLKSLIVGLYREACPDSGPVSEVDSDTSPCKLSWNLLPQEIWLLTVHEAKHCHILNIPCCLYFFSFLIFHFTCFDESWSQLHVWLLCIPPTICMTEEMAEVSALVLTSTMLKGTFLPVYRFSSNVIDCRMLRKLSLRSNVKQDSQMLARLQNDTFEWKSHGRAQPFDRKCFYLPPSLVWKKLDVSINIRSKRSEFMCSKRMTAWVSSCIIKNSRFPLCYRIIFIEQKVSIWF